MIFLNKYLFSKFRLATQLIDSKFKALILYRIQILFDADDEVELRNCALFTLIIFSHLLIQQSVYQLCRHFEKKNICSEKSLSGIEINVPISITQTSQVT